jgi:hypothetical protein
VPRSRIAPHGRIAPTAGRYSRLAPVLSATPPRTIASPAQAKPDQNRPIVVAGMQRIARQHISVLDPSVAAR